MFESRRSRKRLVNSVEAATCLGLFGWAILTVVVYPDDPVLARIAAPIIALGASVALIALITGAGVVIQKYVLDPIDAWKEKGK